MSSLRSTSRSHTTALLLLLSGMLALPGSAVAEQTEKSSSGLPLQSERLGYEVRFRGARVASISQHIGCPTDKHRSAAMIATSYGLAEDMHSFHIRLDSFFSPTEVLPFQGRTKITEEGKTRSYKSNFTKAPAVKVDAKIFDEQSREQRYTLPTRSHDLLSWMLHYRARTSSWEKGYAETYYVWDGWKLVRLETKILGQQNLETPYGKYKTWAVDLTRTRMKYDKDANAFKVSSEPSALGTLWFTTDAEHILVGMDFDSRIGVANIRLAKAERDACGKKK